MQARPTAPPRIGAAPAPAPRRPARRPARPPQAAPQDASASSSSAPVKDPFATKETYTDGPFARFMISYFSRKMSAQLGNRPYTPDYDGFVDLSREIVRGRSSAEQRATVAAVLESLLPPGGPARFRKWFPLSKWSAEANAFFTKVGFGWLVGPMETVPVEVDLQSIGLATTPTTETWNSGVLIKKCRYLEASGCVGLCVNLCKRPTEAFFADAFGLPLHMIPNPEDLSCEMRFACKAPPIEQDPVYELPCFVNQCSFAAPAGPCPKVDTERGQKKAA